MNLAIAASVFPLIFVAELPDKTMFTSLLLATRGRPVSVWCGAAAAFAVHVTIAATVGAVVVKLVPHRAVDGIVAAVLLLAGLLALREAAEARKRAAEETEIAVREARTHRQTMLAAFVAVFVAEWGDLTQLLTADLVAREHAALSVGIGALAALWSVAAVAVIGGKLLSRVAGAASLRVATAVVLFVLAGIALWSAIH